MCRSHVAAQCRQGACGTGCAVRYAMCMLHRRALRVASARVASEQCIALYVASPCCLDACCMGARSTLHRCALHVACFLGACCTGAHARCIGACCMLHNASARVARCIGTRWRVASLRVACCSGACCTLHVANTQPSRSARSCSPLFSVCCGYAARLGEGVARCDMLCIVFRTVRCTLCVLLAAGTPRCVRHAVC